MQRGIDQRKALEDRYKVSSMRYQACLEPVKNSIQSVDFSAKSISFAPSEPTFSKEQLEKVYNSRQHLIPSEMEMDDESSHR